MDGELLRWLYHRLLHDPKLAHARDCTYGEGCVCFAYLLGVLANRSLLWAADKRHWPAWCQRVAIPSYSQLCKRLQRPAMRDTLDALNAELRNRLPRAAAAVPAAAACQ